MSEWRKYEGDSTKVFYCAHHSLKNNLEVERFLRHIVDYLNGLSILDKKENWIFDHILKKSWTEKEIQNMAIANVAAARITLHRLLQKFPKVDNEVLKEFVNDLICDIAFWMKKVDPKQDFSWFIFNTNNSVSHSYQMAVRFSLYGIDEEKFKTYDARFVNATLLIRHTIEQRIKGILGIDYIRGSNGPISLSIIIEVLSDLCNLKPKAGIDFKRISKINDWANHYLHRGLRPHPWQLEWAENELSKMFFIGGTSDKRTRSIYAAFETETLSKVREEFEFKLNKKLNDVRIEWRVDAEIYEVDRNQKYNSDYHEQ